LRSSLNSFQPQISQQQQPPQQVQIQQPPKILNATPQQQTQGIPVENSYKSLLRPPQNSMEYPNNEPLLYNPNINNANQINSNNMNNFAFPTNISLEAYSKLFQNPIQPQQTQQSNFQNYFSSGLWTDNKKKILYFL